MLATATPCIYISLRMGMEPKKTGRREGREGRRERGKKEAGREGMEGERGGREGGWREKG